MKTTHAAHAAGGTACEGLCTNHRTGETRDHRAPPLTSLRERMEPRRTSTALDAETMMTIAHAAHATGGAACESMNGDAKIGRAAQEAAVSTR